jgi:very-short-patch-repair endonuclease
MIKVLDKFENICLVDGKKITNKNGRAIHLLSQHLKKEYNISLKDYILKYYYNNIVPKCLCGCGKEVNYLKGKFGHYYDNHKNFVKLSDAQKEVLRIANLEKNKLENRLKKLNKTKEEIILMYDFFINYTYNFTDITKKYQIDKRTLKKLWSELNLIKDKKKFEDVCKKHQKLWCNKNNKAGGKQHIDENLLLDIYYFLKNNISKYTINELTNKFNISTSSLVLYKRLCENFGESKINEYLRLGLSSKPENEYYNVLKYYFGKSIQRGFKLEGKFYDFILCDKIIIEYDGDYWHNQLKNIENDRIKDDIAKKHGYIIFRVKESECKNIEILYKLKKLYETQIQRNQKKTNY